MLNRSERECLSSIAVRAKYGAAANSYSASIANSLLESFPSLEKEFKVLANIVSSERVVDGLISVLCHFVGAERNDPYTTQRQQMRDSKDEISEALYDWCESVGRLPLELVDADVNCGRLSEVQSLKDYMTAVSDGTPEIALFAGMLPGGGVDLMSLIE